MKRMVLNNVARQRSVWRQSTRFFAPALLMATAPLLMIDRADAACTPPSPVSNTNAITCASDTNNQQGGGVGYGTGTDSLNVYTIQAGVTVQGQLFGFVTGNGGNFTNAGTILGQDDAGIGGGT